jgi:hypothetical protein
VKLSLIIAASVWSLFYWRPAKERHLLVPVLKMPNRVVSTLNQTCNLFSRANRNQSLTPTAPRRAILRTYIHPAPTLTAPPMIATCLTAPTRIDTILCPTRRVGRVASPAPSLEQGERSIGGFSCSPEALAKRPRGDSVDA